MKRTALFIAAIPCSHSAFAARPNIVFILADDMRPDAISALGHPVVKTPNLDMLALEGATFTRALVGYPICTVMHGPGIPRGERITAQCYLRDLFPTTCDFAGIAIPPTVQTRTCNRRLRGERKGFRNR